MSMDLAKLTLFGTAAIMAAWLSLRFTKRRKKLPGPRCLICSYSLRGTDLEGTCPECGADLILRPPVMPQKHDRVWCVTALFTWTGAMYLLTFIAMGLALQRRDTSRYYLFLANHRLKPYMFEWIVPETEWCILQGTIYRAKQPHRFRFSIMDQQQEWTEIIAEFDDETGMVTQRGSDGKQVVADIGLLSSFETWWSASGVDMTEPSTRAELEEILSLIQIGEGDSPVERQHIARDLRLADSYRETRTPWFIQWPIVCLALGIWASGMGRIRNAMETPAE